MLAKGVMEGIKGLAKGIYSRKEGVREDSMKGRGKLLMESLKRRGKGKILLGVLESWEMKIRLDK